jgi:hypothetical protein
MEVRPLELRQREPGEEDRQESRQNHPSKGCYDASAMTTY